MIFFASGIVKYEEKNLDITKLTKPCYSEHILPVPPQVNPNQVVLHYIGVSLYLSDSIHYNVLKHNFDQHCHGYKPPPI